MALTAANLEALVNKLLGLVKTFGENGQESNITRTAEELMRVLEELQTAKIDRSKDHALMAKINSSAVTLWNLSVAMRSGKKANNLVNAKARHVACHLTFLASTPEMTEISCRRKISMTLKTGKAWLDCGNNSMAESCFLLASECWSKIQMMRDCKLEDDKTNIHDQQQMQECEMNMLKVYAYRSEVAISMSDEKMAQEYIQKAKMLLSKHPKQSSMIATFCYNFGVEYFQKEAYDSSIVWLRESYEIGKGNESEDGSSQKIQATCLRLISKAYYELGGDDNRKKALNSVDLSIAEESNPRSFYLKLRILLEMKEENESHLTLFLEETLNHPGLKIELALQIIKIIVSSKRNQLISRAFEVLIKRFQKPQDVTCIQLENLEYFLEEKQFNSAKMLVTDHLITGINQLSQNDAQVSKKFHLLVWEQASIFFEEDKYEEALIWYDFSKQCFSKSDQESKNIAKLQRNRASCFLGVGQYDQALTAVKEANLCEPDSPQTYFLNFKICLASTDNEQAIRCLEKLGELALEDQSSELIYGFICLAAQLAFKDGNRDVAAVALEKIIRQATEPKQILTSLRCLTRLKYTYLSPVNQREEIKCMLGYVKKAYETLPRSSSAEIEPEVQWFIKIAWNLGITCQDNYRQMYDSFVLCYELSQLLLSPSKPQQKTCLLMASAAGIETVKETKEESEKNLLLHDIRSYIQKCEEIYRNIQTEKSRNDKPDPTLSILVSLEFEVNARLGNTNLDGILEKAKSISHIEAKTFEAIAATAFSLPGDFYSVGIKSLKIAIKLHLENEITDYTQLSKDLHTLVNTALKQGGNSNTQSKEEAYQYYQNIFEIIQRADKNAYPEMEILWLMTKAWNCGVHFFSARAYDFCEKWCGMAMKMLDKLDSLKSNYDTHMTSVYADMLERKERAAVRNQIEE